MPALEHLGDAIRYLFERSRYRSQRELADAAQITQGTLSSYLAGRKTPSMEALGALLDAMGATTWDLAAALDAAKHPSTPEPFGAPPAPARDGAVDRVRELSTLLEQVAAVSHAAAAQFRTLGEAQEARHRLEEAAAVLDHAARKR